MANCCDGKKPRKVKEWGTENKESNSDKIKLLTVLGVVVIIGIIAYTFI